MSTASCTSAITYIDGDAGILLVSAATDRAAGAALRFPRGVYLLLNGELPNRKAEGRVRHIVTHHTMVHEQLAAPVPRGSARATRWRDGSAWSARSRPSTTTRSTSITRRHPRHLGVPPDRQDPTIVGMSTSIRSASRHVPEERSLLHRQLHAHDVRGAGGGLQAETTCWCGDGPASSSSTPTTSRTLRLDRAAVGSSGANPYACIAAGIACLWGPAHGGANEACLQMLEEIGDVSKIPRFIKKVKDKNSHVRLMGFGHRVYKNFDPRAKLMRETCHEVLNELGLHNDRLFKACAGARAHRARDDYFLSRKLYPNVDFYSGIVQRALGIRWRCSPASSRSRAPSAGSRNGRR